MKRGRGAQRLVISETWEEAVKKSLQKKPGPKPTPPRKSEGGK